MLARSLVCPATHAAVSGLGKQTKPSGIYCIFRPSELTTLWSETIGREGRVEGENVTQTNVRVSYETN